MNLEQLKTKASDLGLTEENVGMIGNLRYKATWEEAIRLQEQLNAEKEAENAEARRRHFNQSPAAAVVVPVATVAAAAEYTTRGLFKIFGGKG